MTAVVMSFAVATGSAQAQTAGASRDALVRHLDAIARSHLEARARVVTAITTRQQADARRAEVRQTILRLIGGLPETRAPLAARTVGALERDGFAIERVIFDSFPGMHVTANVYLPSTLSGRLPAVLLSPGHSPGGKTELYELGANLARLGFVALAWDPVGQGERLQHFDEELAASKVGRPTGEHGHDSVQTMVVGEHLSRYMVWDAMRALDYLAARPEVDATRMGAFGCSGGGTITAYLAALDERVVAVASGCYMTTWEALLATAGPQDAEQTIPAFVAEGLDFADWILAAAPRPYAVVSTTEDMFPFEGAQRTAEEARRLYGLLDAAERFQFISGPGGHGALGPTLPDVLAFFTRWLQGRTERPTWVARPPVRAEQLQCTPTGQLSTSLAGETVRSINRQRAVALLRPVRPMATATERDDLRRQVRADSRRLAGVTVSPGDAPPRVKVTATADRSSYRLETLEIDGGDGLALPASLAVPNSAGPHPAMLLLLPEVTPRTTASGQDLDLLARAATMVLAMPARPAPPGTEEIKSPLLGSSYLLSLRAFVVGRTLVGLRTDDTLRAVEWLRARPEVDPSRVGVYGLGSAGPVALHAAVLDDRIAHTIVERSLVSWRSIVDLPIHRNASEVVVAGVLRAYDIDDLLAAIAPRTVLVLDPVDAVDRPVPEGTARETLARALRIAGAPGNAAPVRLRWRSPGEPLPVP